MAQEGKDPTMREGLIDHATAQRLRSLKEREDRQTTERPSFQLYLSNVIWAGGRRCAARREPLV